MKLTIGKTYYLACKFPDKSQFWRVDCGNGRLTNRKIFATIFQCDSPEKITKMEDCLKEYKEAHPEAQFEFRVWN